MEDSNPVISFSRTPAIGRLATIFALSLGAAAAALPGYAAGAVKTYPMPAVTQATVYTTARDTGQRISAGSPIQFHPVAQPDEHAPTIIVDPTHRYQTIVGFGGAFTDAAAETFYKMPAAAQQQILTAYFSPDQGIGYTLGRTNISSCDFSSDIYNYDAVPGDTGLTHFTIAHDLTYKIPFIKAAEGVAGGNIKLFASPWSPPAWMKDNDNVLHGGKLKPEDRQPWANYFVRFLQEYQKQGISFWGLTMQNEPLAAQTWESCIYTASDEHDFILNYLGPTLQKAGFSKTNVMLWDHNRGLLQQQAETTLSDPKAAKYVWGTAYHWYTGNHFENPDVVHDQFPDKGLLLTEACTYPFTTEHMMDWSQGETYATSELNDLNHYSAGWTDWNLILNQQGGPNHVSNYCFSPVIADTSTGQVHYLSSYYYLGQVSKFVRPGAQRLASTSNDDDLLATSFVNPDNSIATVVLNATDNAKDVDIWMNGQAVTLHSPVHSIETIVMKP